MSAIERAEDETEMTQSDPAASAEKKGAPIAKFAILAVLVGALGAFFAFGGGEYLSFDALRDNRQWLLDQVDRNAGLAIAVFIALYAVIVAFSFPGGLIMTLTGGFLFGTVLGGLYTVVGATLGATLLFLAARYLVGDMLQRKAGSWVQKMEAGFRDGEVSYMLVLRLVPLFPFFVVNLVPALLGVRLSTYLWTTFFGIMPGTFVYASVGNGLGAVFDRGEQPNLGIIFEPQIIGPLLALSVLAMVPVIYKRIKARKQAA